MVLHVEQVLAIELLAACQALEFHRPRTTTAPLEDVYKLVRTVVRWDTPLHDNSCMKCLSLIRPWDKDRYMAPDIESATRLLQEGKVQYSHYHLGAIDHSPLSLLPFFSFLSSLAPPSHLWHLPPSSAPSPSPHRSGMQWEDILSTIRQKQTNLH